MSSLISEYASVQERPCEDAAANKTCLSVSMIGLSGYAEVVRSSLLEVMKDGSGKLVAITSEVRAGEHVKEDALREAGCRIFRDYREMLQAVPVDLCLIPTGIHWHATMAREALSTGANVLVEKPLAGCMKDAQSMLVAEAASQRFIAVGFQDMYSPITHTIHQYLQSGELGAVRRVRVTGSWPRGREYYSRNDWAGRLSNGAFQINDSPLNNAFAHFLNLALLFATASGEPLEGLLEHCDGWLLRHFPIESFDSAAFVMEAPSGVRLECVFTHADTAVCDPVIDVETTHGSLHWAFEAEAHAKNAAGTIVQDWQLESAEESRQRMLWAVLRRVVDPQAPVYAAEDAISHCRVVESVMKRLGITPVDTDEVWDNRPGRFRSLCEMLESISLGKVSGKM